MIVHQDIRVDLGIVFRTRLFGLPEIETVVVIPGENDVLIVAALDDVLWFARQDETW